MRSSSGINVVLVEPEIPPNTGSIGRLCAATRSRLHLVEPLGFSLEDRYLRRAGLDYWPFLDLVVHESWASFAASHPVEGACFFSARAESSYLAAPYEARTPLYLIFGGETRGLDRALLAQHSKATYRVPIFHPEVRSLNLANAVSIVVYEALRQRGALDAVD